jgi:hypothetical protein
LVALLKPTLGFLFSAMLVTVTLNAATEAPDSVEQQKILDRVRQSAARYLDSLPNFVCSRVTQQYEAGRKPQHWKQRDTLTERLIFNQGKEDLSLQLVNGKAVPADRFIARPLETSGEFGELLKTILDEKSHADLSWTRWDDLNGRRVAVFEYAIDQEHSRISVSLDNLEVFVPYRGSLYADPETGDLWRITCTLLDMPATIQTKSAVTTVDYGPVTITEKQFLLPVRATIEMNTGKNNLLNKIVFNQYRRFETDSKITFLSGSN